MILPNSKSCKKSKIEELEKQQEQYKNKAELFENNKIISQTAPEYLPAL